MVLNHIEKEIFKMGLFGEKKECTSNIKMADDYMSFIKE